MTDYSKLSDFEINRRVLKIVSRKNPVRYAHNADGRSSGIKGDNDRLEWFDYCNSWADAGPIIYKNEISIIFHWNDAGIHGAVPAFPNSYFEDANPLRAAMIVFLMMKDAEA